MIFCPVLPTALSVPFPSLLMLTKNEYFTLLSSSYAQKWITHVAATFLTVSLPLCQFTLQIVFCDSLKNALQTETLLVIRKLSFSSWLPFCTSCHYPSTSPLVRDATPLSASPSLLTQVCSFWYDRRISVTLRSFLEHLANVYLLCTFFPFL